VIPGFGGRVLHAVDLQHVVLVVVLWMFLTASSLAVVLWFAVGLPEDYFEAESRGRTGWSLRRVARNLAGVVLILVGAALSIPGVPGQGVLTVLVGLFLVDFPQRQRLERTLVNRPGVLPMLNRLRTRFGRPPLRPPRR
jgi:hypothetical protein